MTSIYRRFPKKESCLEHLEKVRCRTCEHELPRTAEEILEKARWPDKKTCPYCLSEKISGHKEPTKTRFQCSLCKRSFSATTKTFLHGTHIDLALWFGLIKIMKEDKNFSAAQATKKLKIRYATVLSMAERIKGAKKDKLLNALEDILCLAIKP